MYETVLYEKDDGVANIALNRPEKLNAFDSTMHEELYDALGEAADDEEIRCIVLRGEGRGFSAGADLAQVVESSGRRPRPRGIPAHHVQQARKADGRDREAHNRRPARACLRCWGGPGARVRPARRGTEREVLGGLYQDRAHARCRGHVLAAPRRRPRQSYGDEHARRRLGRRRSLQDRTRQQGRSRRFALGRGTEPGRATCHDADEWPWAG